VSGSRAIEFSGSIKPDLGRDRHRDLGVLSKQLANFEKIDIASSQRFIDEITDAIWRLRG